MTQVTFFLPSKKKKKGGRGEGGVFFIKKLKDHVMFLHTLKKPKSQFVQLLKQTKKNYYVFEGFFLNGTKRNSPRVPQP
jgi:hypothetical protein